MVHVKVCGVTSVADAEMCLELGVRSIGVNLIPESPRYIDERTAKEIAAHVGTRALMVGVVANRSPEDMLGLRARTGIVCLQLHGDEPPASLEPLLPHAYKAIRVAGPGDVEAARAYGGEYMLVDAKVAGTLGGSGKTLPWDLVVRLAQERKLSLAGGLTADNVADAIRVVRPFCVDVASGVEASPRSKDRARVAAFMAAVRQAG